MSIDLSQINRQIPDFTTRYIEDLKIFEDSQYLEKRFLAVMLFNVNHVIDSAKKATRADGSPRFRDWKPEHLSIARKIAKELARALCALDLVTIQPVHNSYGTFAEHSLTADLNPFLKHSTDRIGQEFAEAFMIQIHEAWSKAIQDSVTLERDLELFGEKDMFFLSRKISFIRSQVAGMMNRSDGAKWFILANADASALIERTAGFYPSHSENIGILRIGSFPDEHLTIYRDPFLPQKDPIAILGCTDVRDLAMEEIPGIVYSPYLLGSPQPTLAKNTDSQTLRFNTIDKIEVKDPKRYRRIRFIMG